MDYSPKGVLEEADANIHWSHTRRNSKMAMDATAKAKKLTPLWARWSWECQHGHVTLLSNSECTPNTQQVITVIKQWEACWDWEGVHKKSKRVTNWPKQSLCGLAHKSFGCLTRPYKCDWCTQQHLRSSPGALANKVTYAILHRQDKGTVWSKPAWLHPKKIYKLAQPKSNKNVTMMLCILCHVFVAWGYVDDCESNHESIWSPGDIPQRRVEAQLVCRPG